MYEYVDYVLANYLNVEIGHSEEEAITILCAHLASNATLCSGVRAHMKNAFSDEKFSWKEALSSNGVATFENEAEAREYAYNLLWKHLFKE